MRRTAIAIAVAIAGALALPAGAAAAPPATSPYVVVLDDAVPNADAAIDGLRAAVGFTPRFRYRSALKGFAARLSAGQVAALRAEPAVAFVEPDVAISVAGQTPLAAGEVSAAGVRRIGAATTTTAHDASGTAVAVLDTGVDLANPDLGAVTGINCVKPGAAAQDDNGHGTHDARACHQRTSSRVCARTPRLRQRWRTASSEIRCARWPARRSARSSR